MKSFTYDSLLREPSVRELVNLARKLRGREPLGFVCEVCGESEDGGCACCRAAGEAHMRRYHGEAK